MKKYILIILTALVITGCSKKDNVAPSSLIGTWNALTPPMQFVIDNIEGAGNGRFTFTVVNKVPEYYLLVKDKEGNATKYGIYQPDNNNLYLTDELGQQIHLKRGN